MNPMLDLIACSIPGGRGYHAPQARHPVDDVVTVRLVHEASMTYDIRRQRAPSAPAPKHRAPKSAIPAELSRAVFDVVRARPGCTANEVRLVLKRQGTPVHGERVIAALEQHKKIKRTDLRSQRDIDRAGARWLWSAVETKRAEVKR